MVVQDRNAFRPGPESAILAFLVNNNRLPPPLFLRSVDSKGASSCFRINTFGSVDSKGSYGHSGGAGVSSLFATLPNSEKTRFLAKAKPPRGGAKQPVRSGAQRKSETAQKLAHESDRRNYADLPENHYIT
jgi:hypothetical protein